MQSVMWLRYRFTTDELEFCYRQEEKRLYSTRNPDGVLSQSSLQSMVTAVNLRVDESIVARKVDHWSHASIPRLLFV